MSRPQYRKPTAHMLAATKLAREHGDRLVLKPGDNWTADIEPRSPYTFRTTTARALVAWGWATFTAHDPVGCFPTELRLTEAAPR